jgi:hypothetical protein
LEALSGASPKRSDLSEAEQATKDALSYLSEMENHWDYMIYRVAKSPADIDQLMNWDFTKTAKYITHKLISNG